MFVLASVLDISARKRGEVAVRSSEEQFRTAFDNAPIGMALVAIDGFWQRVNRRLCEITGFTEAELLTTDFQRLTHPEDLNTDLELVRQVLEGTIPSYQVQKRFFHKSGRIIDVLLAVSLVRTDTGDPLHFISQIKDITEHKRAERAAASNEALLRQFIRHSPAAIAMFDCELRYLQVSDRWVSDYHLGDQDVIGRSHYDVFPDIPERWKEVHRRVLAGAVEGSEEDPFHRADGTTEWLQWECRPWYSADADIGGLIMFTQVVSARKHAEDQLRASEERLRMALRGAEAGVWECSLPGWESYWSAEYRELYGYSADEDAHVEKWRARVHPDDLPRIEANLSAIVKPGQDSWQQEFRLVVPGVGVRWILDFVRVIRNPDGTPAGVGGVNIDITTRKQAEAAIRESEDRFRAFMDNSPAIAWMKDQDGRYVYLSGGFEKNYQVQLVDWLGKTDQEIWPAALADELQQNDRAVLAANRVLETIERVPNSDGEYRVWRVHKFPLRSSSGERYVGGTALDVTNEQSHRDRVDASLREKEVLLKEIHHRVKNNLQIVSALLELQAGHTNDPAVNEMFSESQGRVLSMAMIHERLYKSADLSRVDFTQYVAQLAVDLYRTYKVSDEDIRLELGIEIPPLPIDIAIPCGLLLNELFSNCLKHAFKNADRVGYIRVEFRRQSDGTNLMAVSDDGLGLPVGFDIHDSPSFGMQLITTLVDQLKGKVTVVGTFGTQVTITFPTK
jgi:PAS domain S-box-containing protein